MCLLIKLNLESQVVQCDSIYIAIEYQVKFSVYQRLFPDNAKGWKIVQKTFGREAKLRGQLWNIEDNLSAEGIIFRYTSKPEMGLFIL